MKRFLSDKAIERLRNAGVPDLSGTRYTLVEFLARGGMGAVYLAEDRTLNRLVALKMLETEDAEGRLAERLVREARALAQLEHPGIVPVHDAGTLSDGRVFYAMKYVQGTRLDKVLGTVGVLSERLRLFLRICEAVSFAHSRGMVHRDLKPGNVMVGPFGEVLVMDWGLAKILGANAEAGSATGQTQGAAMPRSPSGDPNSEATEVTSAGMVLGTPGYMSPEQAAGESSKIDFRSDIFSLGRLLEFMVSQGQPPRALRAICTKAAAADREARYPSVQALAEDLASFLDGHPVSAYRENPWERSRRFYGRHQAAILLVTMYLAMRVLFALFSRHPL